jgi:hypothetical protein
MQQLLLQFVIKPKKKRLGHLWEKWERKVGYEKYILTSDRSENSEFLITLLNCFDGETSKPWIDFALTS